MVTEHRTQETFDKLLENSAFSLTQKEKKVFLLDSLQESYRYHFENCKAFARYCTRRGLDQNSTFEKFEDFPYLPVQAFKEFWSQLVSVPSSELKLKLQSSATSGKPSTIGVDKETSKRQIKVLSSVLSAVLGPKRRPFLIMDVDPRFAPLEAVGARGAAVRGFLNLARESHYCMNFEDQKLVFNTQAFANNLKQFETNKDVGIILGFTFVLYAYAVKPALDQGLRFKLPAGTKVVHIGGWKKLEDQKVSKEQFNADVAEVFGIAPSDVIDFYGFTEQMGVTYPDDPSGIKLCPSFSEVVIRDPDTLDVLPDGQVGLLQFLTPVPHSYPGFSVLTDDLGVVVSRDYKSPGTDHVGTGFKVLGRAKKAEIRGCGDIMGEKISVTSGQKQKSDEQRETYLLFSAERNFGPKDLNGDVNLKNLPRVEHLNILIDQLKAGQEKLQQYSVDELISLIGAAASNWVKPGSPLTPLIPSGLSFLSGWCQPQSLRRMLNQSLRGNRTVLDNFVAADGISGRRLYRAQSRGVVAHWLAGNVPLLGMLSLAQSILAKNANILKAAKSYSSVMPLLLESFRNLEVKSINGKILKGNDILESIAVVYFDRHHQEAAETLSLKADVRLAWGGREAVESVMSLPRMYGTDDIVFGPKLSYMAIGKEMLDQERTVKKIARAAAIDSSVFDQYACASPHSIFIEKGGKFISPAGFCELLAEQMERVSLRIPKDPVDAGTLAQIHRKRLEYEFNETLWASKDTTWTVLYDEKIELADPCYSRVITVRGVDNILDAAKLSSKSTQTVGLAMSSERKQLFAETASRLGAERFPDLGRMTYFDSPWDGIYPVERLIRWVSLGGPF